MMRCLVTGAKGFIGNSLVNRLLREGYKVRGLVHNKSDTNRGDKIEYISGDIRDKNILKKTVKDVDFVIHCAALVKDYGRRKDFYEINYEGTKNLVDLTENIGLKRFIYLSHIMYESNKPSSYYSITKKMAEDYLLQKHRLNGFPMVIIRPGNVYGPGATTWVLRPLDSIKKNRIALIEKGNGIFLHTYIDNLIDAIILAMNKKGAIGETINITDGDNTITWAEYLNSLANFKGEKIDKNLTRKKAMIIAKTMMVLYKLFKVKPWVTPAAVDIFCNKKKIGIDKAEKILGYKPKVNFDTGMKNVEKWLKEEGYIK